MSRDDELRVLVERVVEAAVALERVESSWCGDPNELEVPRRELEDAKSALLTRTEAGADGAVPFCYVLAASVETLTGEVNFLCNKDRQTPEDTPLYTHPHDASARDAVVRRRKGANPMTTPNPQDVGGQWPAFPPLPKHYTTLKVNGAPLFDAFQLHQYAMAYGELCRAAPAGGDVPDARDEQEHDDELCFPEHEVEAMKLEDAKHSAPAVSVEVEKLVRSARAIIDHAVHGEPVSLQNAHDKLTEAAALLRKLQQGAE